MLWGGLALPLTKLLLKKEVSIYIVGRLLLFCKPGKRHQEKLYGNIFHQEIYYSLKNRHSLSSSGERQGAMASKKHIRAYKIDPMNMKLSTLTGIHVDKET